MSVAGTATTVARGDTDGLQRLADRTRRLTGARQLALSLVLGITAVAALPPVHAVPALIPAFTGFVWQLEGTRTRRRAFTVGWLFGLGFFAAGLYWVGIAFLVQAEIYGWMMPFAVAGLAGGLAIFTGLAALGVHMLPCRGTATRVLALTVAWMVASWLRGHVLTGFPWNLMATVWDPWPVMLQSAAVWGAWGLSTVTVFGAAAFAVLGACGSVSRRAGLPMTAVAVLAGVAGYGMTRLNAAPAAGAEHVDGVRLRIVQPSIPQAQKWDRDKRLAHLKTYLGLTRRPGLDEVSHVIWPETAVPLFLSKTQGLRDALGSVAPSNGALLTGLPRLVRADGTRRMYNSLYVIDGEGRTAARYDKFHLVPFGEYVPLEHWIPFPKLTAGRTGFTAGPGPRTLGIPGGPSVSPLICYEAIFPGNVTARGPRPGWLLNLTNDAWFGVSSGPYQHLASARLRAIEEGLALVRAANTGISVVVDPHGRTWARLGLHERDVMDANLPHALPTTIYAQLGDIGFAGLIFLIISGLLPMLRR